MYVKKTLVRSHTAIISWSKPEEVASVKSVEVNAGSAEIHKTNTLPSPHLLHPNPSVSLTHTSSSISHISCCLESGPITERRDEQLLCVQSSDDGVIQHKSNRQRPSLSLHLFLHLCLSLLFLFSLCESWTNACPWSGSLLVLFLDNQGCSLYILWCKH